MQIVAQPNSYWYQVKAADGSVGYTSTDDKYISVNSSSVGTPTAPSAQTGTIKYGVNLRTAPSTSGKVLRLLKKGNKYSFWHSRTAPGIKFKPLMVALDI